MKYLVVCDGGNVRSHALAFVLKYHYNQEAIAAGRLHLSPDTMHMLSEWADMIILMRPNMINSIPTLYHSKVRKDIDIGDDRWGVSIHPELFDIVQQIAAYLIPTPTIQLLGPQEPTTPKKFGEL